MKFGRLKENGILIQTQDLKRRLNLDKFLRYGPENGVFAIYSNICFSLITFSLKIRTRARLFWDDL